MAIRSANRLRPLPPHGGHGASEQAGFHNSDLGSPVSLCFWVMTIDAAWTATVSASLPPSVLLDTAT